MAQNIFGWNYISEKLTENEITKLKNYTNIIIDFFNVTNGNT